MKKRNIILWSALSLGIFLLSSCSDYLNVDKYFKDRMTEEKVFASKDYCDNWLAGVYAYLSKNNMMDVGSKGAALHNFADDMFFGDSRDLNYATFRNGFYNEGTRQDTWTNAYIGIRDASTMIHNIDINQEMSHEDVADYKAQARFLRAYFYWILLRKYGPVPILPDEGLDYMQDYDALACSRNTYDECANFIANEMVLAAYDLPMLRDNRNIARPTRGAALAARAKVLLYAASPLANGNTEMVDLTDDQGNCLISQTYDESKWARAAAAAKDVMDLNFYELYTAAFREQAINQAYPATVRPPYHEIYSNRDFPDGWRDIDPFESYRSLFNGDVAASDNPELIFTRGQNQNANEDIVAMGQHQMPSSVGGWNCHGMTQKQCDAYYMNDGKNCQGMNSEYAGEAGYEGRVDLNPRDKDFVTQAEINAGTYPELGPQGEGISKQYAHREPRFYASVAYNGSVWEMTSAQDQSQRYQKIWYYRDYPNGQQVSASDSHNMRTGIGIKKYYNPQDSYIKDAESTHSNKIEPAIRYAEILLIYAEALNELENGPYEMPSWDGSKTVSVGRNTREMQKAMSQIRIRAGLPDFDQTIYDDPDEFRKCLKRERQIELFAEGHRYYDLRRWKDASKEEVVQVYGCNMNLESAQREAFHSPVVISSLPSVFVKKMYFWPISHDELRKNRKLTQNPGWTYFD